jgi:hypothetical protein
LDGIGERAVPGLQRETTPLAAHRGTPIPTQTRRPAARWATRLVLATLLVAGLVTPALGWSNGPAVPAGGTNRDGYGTHDWVIDQALKVVDGRASSWFDAQAARLASDDPDTSGTSPGIEHVYRDQGQRGGAVHLITEYYAEAMRYYKHGAAARAAGDDALAAANFRIASERIGLLSHYYADILQPYHTAYAAVGNDAEHIAYELLVDRSTKKASDRPEWSSSSRTVTRVSNVRAMAIAAAAYSRGFYSELHARFAPDQTVLSTRVQEITGLMFKWGANDLANIITSIPLATGNPPPVATLVASVKWRYPKVNEPAQQVYVTATDAAGRPIEGLAVDVAWPLAEGGTTTIRIYTDPVGKSHWTRSVGASPLMERRTATLRASTRSVVATAATWYATSPVLATGLDGFKTTNDNSRPSAGEYVTVSSTLRDTAGRPVAGLPVTWRWTYDSTVVITSATTNASGVATSRRLVTSTTTWNRVTIAARVQSGSQNRNSSTSFQRS